MKIRLFVIISAIVSFVASPVLAQMGSGGAANTPRLNTTDRFVPVVSRNGMVASREKIASQVGADILAQGGNAVDAAVAVGYALAVTYPQAGNIGGGGFMVVHLAEENKSITIDYREMAPAKAHRDMYLNEDGSVNDDRSKYGPLASGVPGTVAGMSLALEKYGTMSLKQVIEPAYKLAKDGFPMYNYLVNSLNGRKERLAQNEAAAKVFYKADGSSYEFGEILKQDDLAWSLKQIMDGGPDAFYKGEIAKRIAADSKAQGGLITEADMANYVAKEREAIVGTYKDYKVVTMPPPSSGGVHLVQMMNMLENDDLKSKGHNSAAMLHLYIEAMRQAYADRSKYLGDPDFSDVPVADLTSKEYAAKVRALIPEDRSRRSTDVAPALDLVKESPDTTHYSVMDKWGNAVSNTYTLNFSYGSHMMAAGTGILMNNEMDDFSAKPGTPNGYGLIGGEANSVQPKKRPLSSMTPTIVLKDDKPFFVTGSPGGSTIITVVMQSVLNVVEFDMNAMHALAAPRIHHQWLPDAVMVEEGVSQDTKNILTNMGHQLAPMPFTLGSLSNIMYKDGIFYGAADIRSMDAAAIGID
ncbi:gamma-glutamyltransferase [Pseudemcibacter aquimaris]|uniref:gamma-glutamyltransferase n=1 Tax=Pseudemcibacter aquimaris TaxID=2857064 RepID=UPI002012FA63|nr:gamma-glutamyltransferase [Pseudemcibacter aquimaris]MCC3860241.1 gamma-glutamyltransferase [Pseudemcibacter aquimaris]WDU57566.1 gamma-glutamyltransferase [Pseudemcibacter aquimaris]